MSQAPRLVVRQHAPLRLLLVVGAGVVAALVAVWFAFEWGRSRAGFDGAAARAERAQLNDQIETLQREARPLRLKIAMYETERVGQTRERTELARSIGELQAEVARLTSELAFYKGVVGDSTPGEVVKVQQFRVSRGPAAGQYVMRLVLGRSLRPDETITGRVKVTFEGTKAGVDTSLDLAAASPVPAGDVTFNYRYLETVERTFLLPADFVPARTTVEVTTTRKGVNPVRETYLWNVED
ncbi:MAG: DUF6776 family protein [Steroidobacteraceae bacterium]